MEGPGQAGGGLQEVDLGQVRLVVAEVGLERRRGPRWKYFITRRGREAEPKHRGEAGVLPPHHLLTHLDELVPMAGHPVPRNISPAPGCLPCQTSPGSRLRGTSQTPPASTRTGNRMRTVVAGPHPPSYHLLTPSFPLQYNRI